MRYRAVYFLIALCSLAVLSRMVDLQIVHGEEYSEQSRQRVVKTTTVSAPRGEITDRNGKAMVKNKTGFSLEIHYIKGRKEEDLNVLIARLCSLLDENGKKISYSFPVSDDGNFVMSDADIKAWKSSNNFSEIATAEEVTGFYCEKYKISSDFDGKDKRRIAGVRYEMERTGFSASAPYVLAEDVGQIILTKVRENSAAYPGVVVSAAPVREYPLGSAAAHILGRTGKIYKEEYEQLRGQNYSMNDTIGKQGIEKCFESYLRGTDGVSGVEQSIDGTRVRLVESKPAVPGNNVALTLDAELQQSAEQALADAVQMIVEKSQYENNNAGKDAKSGALAAIDVNSGDVLALASYPSYNPATFNEDYEQLVKDDSLPMFNRAISGAYEPGSTFKMLTAIAALEENVITPSDQIEDLGIYKYYDDYQPACWIYKSRHETHGYQNVSQAIENSCNYFFYDVGRRTGIENIDNYAKKFGLGESTGIELSGEENRGRVASKENREKNGGIWNPGDTMQAAIGQSDNMFTPLQMANYIATIVNGGTRYKAHLVKNVRNTETGAVIYEAKPEVLDKIDLKEENYKAVMEGMRNVIELGTASTVFEGFDVPVGGKTGTAEVSDGSDNAIFVAFAPFDNPQIAVCAVIEHGAHGSNAGVAVKKVLDTYFHSATPPKALQEKNILTR